MSVSKLQMFFRSSFFLVVFSCFLIFISPIVFSGTNEDQLDHAKVDDKLKSIEQHLKVISQNQQQISSKNSEIKSELDSLGIWIRRS